MNKFLLLFSFVFVFFYAQGQEITVSGGGHVQNETGSLSYSIGQVFIDHATDGNAWVHSGIQQGYALVEVSVESIWVDELQINVYPNPVIDDLYIQISGKPVENLTAVLQDADGKVLERFKLTHIQEQFNMSQYLGSKVYFLSFFYKDKLFKTFKLIKQSN